MTGGMMLYIEGEKEQVRDFPSHTVTGKLYWNSGFFTLKLLTSDTWLILLQVTSAVFPLGFSGRFYFIVQQAVLTRTLNCTEASGTSTCSIYTVL